MSPGWRQPDSLVTFQSVQNLIARTSTRRPGRLPLPMRELERSVAPESPPHEPELKTSARSSRRQVSRFHFEGKGVSQHITWARARGVLTQLLPETDPRAKLASADASQATQDVDVAAAWRLLLPTQWLPMPTDQGSKFASAHAMRNPKRPRLGSVSTTDPLADLGEDRDLQLWIEVHPLFPATEEIFDKILFDTIVMEIWFRHGRDQDLRHLGTRWSPSSMLRALRRAGAWHLDQLSISRH